MILQTLTIVVPILVVTDLVLMAWKITPVTVIPATRATIVKQVQKVYLYNNNIKYCG